MLTGIVIGILIAFVLLGTIPRALAAVLEFVGFVIGSVIMIACGLGIVFLGYVLTH